MYSDRRNWPLPTDLYTDVPAQRALRPTTRAHSTVHEGRFQPALGHRRDSEPVHVVHAHWASVATPREGDETESPFQPRPVNRGTRKTVRNTDQSTGWIRT